MSVELLLRVVSGILAVLLAGRTIRRAGAAAAGALAAFAVFGTACASFPEPAEAAALAGGIALLLAFGTRREFPSITEEAARAAAFAAGGAAAVALAAGRRLPGAGATTLVVLAVLAVSSGAAESCRAGGEAGWREGLARALGVAGPALLGAAFSAALAVAQAGWVVAGGLVAAILAWAPAILAESARVKAELAEEVRLALLSAEDAEALRFPWTRRFERRFGRTDERREYVKSALLLAAARHQQRHRSGEAVRLRQLEVLTFRTRLRRTQDARSARFQQSESGEFAREAPPPES